MTSHAQPRVDADEWLEFSMSLKLRAANALARVDGYPFDASDEWLVEAGNWLGDTPAPVAPAPVDWAHRAARGIVAELQDDHGGALERAFSREEVDEQGRVSIIETVAAIIRQACAEHEAVGGRGT